MLENKKIRKIECASKLKKVDEQKKALRRVAVYARVSTDSSQQQTSFETQVDFYTKKVNETPEWELVKIYTDEGISGCEIKNRKGFLEMIADCDSGKIDLIITKSVSRFARNTVDSIKVIRKLKLKGIEIYFEKENIWTLDTKSEFIITLMSSLAQEESRSLSENITWGKRKRMASGEVHFNYMNVLGFKKGNNGGFDIDEEEAKVVRYIFGLFIKGENPNSIARILTQKGIPTPMGKELWSYQTVKSMLQNEKYKGDALLQKAFTVDYLTKQKKKNTGELPQYYIENNHKAIIDSIVFDYVQETLAKNSMRRNKKIKHRVVGLLSGKVQCAECGANFVSRLWHPKSPHAHVVLECHNRYKEKQCKTVHIYDEYLKYIIHDVAKKEVMERGLIDVLLSIIRLKVKAEKYKKIEKYLMTFKKQSVWDLWSDLDDLSLIIDEIKVFKKKKLKIRLLDSKVINYKLEDYSPKMKRLK